MTINQWNRVAYQEDVDNPGKLASGSSQPHWRNEGPIVGRVADISGFILFTFGFFPSVRIDVNTV